MHFYLIPPLESDLKFFYPIFYFYYIKSFVPTEVHNHRIIKDNWCQAVSFFFESDHSTFFGSDAIVFYPRQFLFCYMEEVCISSLFEYFFSKMQKKIGSMYSKSSHYHIV